MKDQKTSIGHKAALWLMVLPTAYLTVMHLAVVPLLIYANMPSLRKFGILFAIYTCIVLAWKSIMAFDSSDNLKRKALLASGWIVLLVVIGISPSWGKQAVHFALSP